MRENFLHYIWKYKKFETRHLRTVDHETVELINVGEHNHDSGPDFFNAKLKINDQLWAGNVEIHVRSSDWYIHGHANDTAFENIILHVVWKNDADIFRPDKSKIPTLELQEFVNLKALSTYQDLFNRASKWINCENEFADIDDFVLQNWMDRLYYERLEKKSIEIESLLKRSNNDWEAILFKMLAKNFGLKVNGEALFSMAKSIDFAMIRKQQDDLSSLEALFFGQAGLLEANINDSYFSLLKSEYLFLKQKYQLSNLEIVPLKFFRLRPPNFPTIRISQLANLYHQNKTLFSLIINTNSLQEFYELFSVQTTTYWETHYTFAKQSEITPKKITKSFIDLLLINSILPLKFCYTKHQGKPINDNFTDLIQNLASEKNSIITKFDAMRKVSRSALYSQALIQLKNNYCDKNKCLHCAIGNAILSS